MTNGLGEFLIERVENIDKFKNQLEYNLRRSLEAENPQALNQEIAFSIKDKNGKNVAGIIGATSYGWLYVHLLWVKDHLQRQGLGSRLLERAENAARELGCHAVWLETSSATAKEFYDAMGFTVFGKLANEIDQVTPNHQRWFMRKELVAYHG